MLTNSNLVQIEYSKISKEKFIQAVETGSIDDVLNCYNNSVKILETYLTHVEIANLFEPVMDSNDDTMSTLKKKSPFVIAMLTGKVDICRWMYSTFNMNIVKNSENLGLYVCIEEVCGYGYLDVLKFINEVFYDVVRCGDYHNDTFLFALESKHYDILEYLYTMYGEKFVLTDLCNIKAVIRGVETGRFKQDQLIYYVGRIINICPDMNLGSLCLTTFIPLFER